MKKHPFKIMLEVPQY